MSDPFTGMDVALLKRLRAVSRKHDLKNRDANADNRCSCGNIRTITDGARCRACVLEARMA